MRADGLTLPYAWNHTITYEDSLGYMPYLVQELRAQDMTVEVLPDQQSLTFTLNASIFPGKSVVFVCVCVCACVCVFVCVCVYV